MMPRPGSPPHQRSGDRITDPLRAWARASRVIVKLHRRHMDHPDVVDGVAPWSDPGDRPEGRHLAADHMKLAKQTDRNLWMTAREAQACRLVHREIERVQEIRAQSCVQRISA